MKSQRLKKAFLFSIFISVLSILFFISLGDVEFITGGLYSWIGNLLGFGILLFQFIIHFPLLVLLDFISRKKLKKTAENNAVFWIYLSIVFILNIILILNATTESRNNLKNDINWRSAEKYEWEEGITCPKGYPIIILNGHFSVSLTHSNDSYYSLENKIYDLNWNIEEHNLVSEFERKRVMPDSLHLLWYSIVEKAYYKLDTPIDKEKITTLFRNGFLSKRHDRVFSNTFDYIVAGVAPGGDVALWARTNWKNSVETGFYKAKKIDSLKISEFQRKECRDKLRNALSYNQSKWAKYLNSKTDTIPYGIWREKYRQKFNWRFRCKLQSKLENSDIDINLFNGEEFVLINDSLSQKENTSQAVPSEIMLTFLHKEHTERTFIELDENNIYTVFEELSGQKKLPVTMECVVNKNGEIESINLKNKDKTIPLKWLEK
ncbi:DUF2931 family protein [Flavobacterium reichenbachii]|uniref:DUF2931 domain-containing protein n=1 Tax=Flavobacterium reichenbachii TaxID=362418 RepID=A0A085ZMV4_9FLAO|nr:DUF2931 family protein [Flavobacterium reichenbachii]KFF05768.1 hypothetical protein IW19_09655 [Flavobacterium reichenbachii]OXB12657.1 hypothetical protein B0A68_17865 [Flavobacterium reichenbachii]